MFKLIEPKNLRSMLTVAAVVVFSILAATEFTAAQSPDPMHFSSPEKAVNALIDAAKKKDAAAVVSVLGPATKDWIISGDPVQDEQGRERLIAAYDEKHDIEKHGNDTAVLVIGNDGFPFPFPIVKDAKGWAFHPEQGKEELLNRRIGENELTTIQVLLAIGDAQRDYATRDWDGDGLRAYASRFASTEGKKDGLFWQANEGEAQSPLGPLVAEAAREGYTPKTDGTESDETNAYHGYRFRILSSQGPNAPGGAYDYVVDKKMVGGFATLAYPARYGVSGIMTFVVSHDGLVYEADLGPETEPAAHAIKAFDPGEGWKKVELE